MRHVIAAMIQSGAAEAARPGRRIEPRPRRTNARTQNALHRIVARGGA